MFHWCRRNGSLIGANTFAMTCVPFFLLLLCLIYSKLGIEPLWPFDIPSAFSWEERKKGLWKVLSISFFWEIQEVANSTFYPPLVCLLTTLLKVREELGPRQQDPNKDGVWRLKKHAGSGAKSRVSHSFRCTEWVNCTRNVIMAIKCTVDLFLA